MADSAPSTQAKIKLCFKPIKTKPSSFVSTYSSKTPILKTKNNSGSSTLVRNTEVDEKKSPNLNLASCNFSEDLDEVLHDLSRKKLVLSAKKLQKIPVTINKFYNLEVRTLPDIEPVSPEQLDSRDTRILRPRQLSAQS